MSDEKQNTVEHFKECSRTPAIPFLVHAWNELIRSGFGDNGVAIWWDDEVLTYTLAGEIVGIMSFAEIKHMKEIFVKIGYVEPKHQRSGIYRALFDALVAIAVERGIPFISGARAVSNDKKAIIDRKMKRVDQAMNTLFAVPLPRKISGA